MERVSAEQMDELEQLMIERFKVSEEALMELAGERVADFLIEEFSRDVKIAFICGEGGNAGDGFVAARRLASKGFDVRVFTPFEREDLSALASAKLEAFDEIGDASPDFPSANIYVDALIGYKLSGELRSPVKEACERINDWSAETVSIDVPTGLDVEKRRVMEESVEPDYTVVLSALKHGVSPTNSGKIFLAETGMREAFQKKGVEQIEFDGRKIIDVDTEKL